MYSKKISIAIILFSTFLLTSCENPSSNDIKIQDTSSTTVGVTIENVEDLNLSQEILQTYIIRSSAGDMPASENELDIDSNTSDVVALIDDGEEPLLLSRKITGDESVTLSLASTAEMMVLFNPQFTGRESSDPRELSKRIRQHEEFSKLESSIKIAITSENPCPIAPRCNAYSARIAAKISREIVIEDLYEGSN